MPGKNTFCIAGLRFQAVSGTVGVAARPGRIAQRHLCYTSSGSRRITGLDLGDSQPFAIEYTAASASRHAGELTADGYPNRRRVMFDR